jgi:phage shock protein A
MLVSGGDALARPALERAVIAEARASEQEKPLEVARRSVQRLREQAERLKAEWETARLRCAQIAANQNAAEALGAASRFSDPYSRAMQRAHRLDQLSRKSAAFDCEAEAAAELLGEHDRVDREIARVDRAAAVDSAMAALKARIAERMNIDKPASPAA